MDGKKLKKVNRGAYDVFLNGEKVGHVFRVRWAGFKYWKIAGAPRLTFDYRYEAVNAILENEKSRAK